MVLIGADGFASAVVRTSELSESGKMMEGSYTLVGSCRRRAP
ncbi:MAG: hypothetical protein ACLR76_07875 [Alistipes sp.]